MSHGVPACALTTPLPFHSQVLLRALSLSPITLLFLWYAHEAAGTTALLTLLLLLLASRPSPPPLLNRIVRLALYLYVCLLLVAAILPPAVVSAALRGADPTFHGSPPRRDPRTIDCSLTRGNLAEALDFYVLAHVLGHVIKAAVLRDRGALWLSAVGFELSESALAGLAPRHFASLAECAWDKVLLDLAVSDAAGMELGLLVCGGSAPLRRWASVVLSAGVVCLVDVLHFGLIAALELDVASPLLSMRMALFASAAFAAMRDLRKWDGRKETALGGAPDLGAMLAAICAETLLCLVHFG